jgi:hypothetical protein
VQHEPNRHPQGSFALFLAGALVRALRKGTISSQGVAYSASERPKMFAFVALSQIAAIVFLGGWPPAEITPQSGT